MSLYLSQLEGKERREECERNDRLMYSSNPVADYNAYIEQFADVKERHYRWAKEKLFEDIETYADWVCVPDENREPSKFFGPISTAELIRLTLNEEANNNHLAEACREIQRRFVEDNRERVEKEAARLAQEEMDD